MTTNTSRGLYFKPEISDTRDLQGLLSDNMFRADVFHKPRMVTQATRPTGPYTGEKIFETDTRQLLVRRQGTWQHIGIPRWFNQTKHYTGQLMEYATEEMLLRMASSGLARRCMAMGGTTATKRHEARYSRGTTQSIPNNTVTPIEFSTTQYDSTDIEATVNNSLFTIKRSGLWKISAGVRFPSSASSTGERLLSIQQDPNGTPVTLATRRDTSTSYGVTLQCSTHQRLAIDDQINAVCLQITGAAQNLDPAFGQYIHISFTWMRP